MVTREEQDTRQRFTDCYGQERPEVVHENERAVIGSNWGANGYTTLAQADRLGDVLRLDAGTRLLDLGAGRGWPGLYLAHRTRCSVVLTDIPFDALRLALERAEHEDLSHAAAAVVASARALPFAGASFDAVVHTDVLC
jgi:methylase of polypeptide subunit release factors